MATILKHSQTSVLINQRCRRMIILSKCVSTHGVCGCRPTLPSALAYTCTHTLSHSLSLRVSVFISFHIKTHLPQMSIIIEIQDSIVFGCSHFIKVALIRNDLIVLTSSNQLHFNDGIIPKAACIQIKLLLKGIRVGIDEYRLPMK